jgi:hypothetical protein
MECEPPCQRCAELRATKAALELELAMLIVKTAELEKGAHEKNLRLPDSPPI